MDANMDEESQFDGSHSSVELGMYEKPSRTLSIFCFSDQGFMWTLKSAFVSFQNCIF